MKSLHEFDIKSKKARNPNIDFIRIAGMFSIIISHILTHGQALKKYTQFNELQLLLILGMWHVSSFGVVSGLIGSKSHKYSNLLYLWDIAVFYSIIFYLKHNKYFPNNLLLNDILLSNIFPVIHRGYWYFTAYFGIFPFLPFINSGISVLSQIEVKKSIYFMMGIFIIWSFYYKDSFNLNGGHSSFCLLIFYIFGAYIDKYIYYRKNSKFIRILICVICLFIYIFLSLICYKFHIQSLSSKSNSKIKNIFAVEVNSFPIVFQTFSITIFIAQIKFNKYLTQIITFLGPLTFDVYLIHENSYVRNNYMRNILQQYSQQISLINILLIIFQKAIFIFVVCILIAYFRSLIFQFLKIKNICNYFEKIATRIIYYLI